MIEIGFLRFSNPFTTLTKSTPLQFLAFFSKTKMSSVFTGLLTDITLIGNIVDVRMMILESKVYCIPAQS